MLPSSLVIAEWCNSRISDLQSTGHGFNCWLDHSQVKSKLINAFNLNLPHWRTTFSTPLSLLTFVLCSIITLPHVLPTPIFCRFHVSTQPLPLAVLALQPPQFGIHYPLASIVLPLQTLSVASLKLTASSMFTAPPSGSSKCLRFGHWLTFCTLNMHILTC